jgi:hypothetical protein
VLVEGCKQRRRVLAFKILGNSIGSLENLAHAQVERRARQPECVGEALADFDVEPAVDAPRQEQY